MNDITQSLTLYDNYFQKASQIIIAYSGGIDSHVLLKACLDFFNKNLQKKLLAIYVHHHLSPNADNWAKHCKKTSEAFKIPYKIIRVNVARKSGESLEAQARTARYLALSKIITKNDILLTAHHQDDQAETCLLQFLRGSGIKGLSAMPAIMPFGQGYLIRPFLNISRLEILNNAQNLKLKWIEDESNLDTKFRRNFLRQKIVPLLKSEWPNLGKTIGRVAQHCAEASLLLEDLAKLDLQNTQGSKPSTLSITGLSQLSIIRQKNLVRYWLMQQHLVLPNTAKLRQIIQSIIPAKPDKNPIVDWGNVEIRRFQDNLYAITKLKSHDSSTVYTWNLKQNLILPNIGILQVHTAQGKGLKIPSKGDIRVRFRQGGETCRLANRKMTHKLKNLFQEWQIPPWERHRIPLIFIDDHLAMIVGYAICEGFQTKPQEKGIIITL